MGERTFDLEERTLAFSKKVILFIKKLPKTMINIRLSDQLLRSATSIGANYREANETETKKDFKNKIRLARQESKKTIYWLKLLKTANKIFEKEIETLVKEAHQLLKILASIYEKAR